MGTVVHLANVRLAGANCNCLPNGTKVTPHLITGTNGPDHCVYVYYLSNL